VTVLFADVVNSMGLAAALDDERLREVMSRLAERSATVARRYGGGTVEYTGDGVMVLFGAPVALEDHAFRACLAALAIQEEANGLAAEVQRHDGVALQLRVGLNSGRVIAGEVGIGSPRYTATGEPVGFAQRMESVAPPGGVMLSDATARLVEHRVMLAEPEWVRVKGSDDPVRARRLLSIGPHDVKVRGTEARLIGRRWEMAALEAILERAIGRRGGVVNVVGPPGIGKSRLARESAALAAARGAEVFWGFCESHARDIPFHVITRLLRASRDVGDLDNQAARAKVRQQTPDADPQDLLLLDDLLGIADPNVPLPQMDPDARRRRLTALNNTRALTRSTPALFIIEDAHWIDAVSESMLADFLALIPRTASMVLITSRPEYEGALLGVHGAQTIAIGPLDDSNITSLLGELLGSDPSTSELVAVIAERAAGNPFFVEEMVRELVQRGVLAGERGGYSCRADLAEVSVPDTVAAAIDARIDRLSTPARQTLNAASVIGARFGAELLSALGIDAALDELMSAELIDQVRFAPSAEYAFRHPLISAVAYESQLRSERAKWHRRLAAAIEECAPDSVEEHAALIAEHLQAAGDLHAAYGWHMRAGAWSANRDLAAARLSWERARQLADELPSPTYEQGHEQLSMRITPRTMLCATDWQAREVQESRRRFAELRELCTAAGDKRSLAIGMTALATELLYAGRTREGARLASEQLALLESIGDPTAAMGVAAIAFCNWLGVGDFGQILRWSQTIVDVAAGDPARGAGFGVGSPLAIALAWRGTARWWLGRPDWRHDLHDAVALALRANPETLSGTIAWTYGFAMQFGVLRVDGALLGAIEAAVQTAQKASSDRALGLAAYTLAVGLLTQDAAADRQRGLEWMMQARDIWLRKRALFLIPVTDVWAARELARRGDRDAAIPMMREAVGELRQAGNLFYGVWGAGVLVETLLEREAADDLAEAEAELDRLANICADRGSATTDIMLLRLRALQSRARGDDVAFGDLASRYRTMAESLGFDGHVESATTMTEGGGTLSPS
jgi:class 3 adenylate cyclase